MKLFELWYIIQSDSKMSNGMDSYENSSNAIKEDTARNVDEIPKKPETTFSTANLSNDSLVKADRSYFSWNNLPSGFKSKPYLLIQPVSIWDEMNTGKLSYRKHR